ncbi:diguanylate cyclase domain-containing protein [Roseospira navarrensis]|uniref:Diguanylate cyclase n=1 Tax=Roseospira navarrensis TaxID=140058 RepID=A0A7X2D4G9_9PROT|nr:diguanylate cyclase [Roseospira navarrensis]MQX36190.1 diguanylate cyclase [Roseospira navarrensis]
MPKLSLTLRDTMEIALRHVQAQAGARHGVRWHYLFVVVLMAIALLVRLLIAPLEGGIQYITFFPSVAIAAVVGGFRVGMVAALLGIGLATYLFWPPYMAWPVGFQKDMWMSNAVFLVDALLVCTAIEAMHRFYRRFLGAESELQLAAAVYEYSSEGILVTDRNACILTVNPAFTRMTGYTQAELVGQTPSMLRSNRHNGDFYQDMWTTLERQGVWQGEVWNRRKTGEPYLQSMSINRAADPSDHDIRYVAVCRDITDSHLQDEKIRYLAFHDALTNLPNRLVLMDRMRQAIARADREGGRLALVYIDLDRFKEVNDTLGHEIGDLLLQQVAQRISDQLRASDTAVRMGGDEFVILMEGQTPRDHYPRVCHALTEAVTAPMTLKGHTVQVGVSLGIAFYPDDAGDMDTLLKRADAAMYRMKSDTRDPTHIPGPAQGGDIAPSSPA